MILQLFETNKNSGGGYMVRAQTCTSDDPSQCTAEGMQWDEMEGYDKNDETVLMEGDETTNDEEAPELECMNEDENCEYWAQVGECDANPNYMRYFCREACGTCDGVHLHPDDPRAAATAAATAASSEMPEFDDDMPVIYHEAPFLMDHSEEYGVRQEIFWFEDDSVVLSMLHHLRRMIVYMKEFLPLSTHRITSKVQESCRNRNESCAFWAAVGECTANPSFMSTECAPSCRSCHLVDVQTRCGFDPETLESALQPGDLNRMFERIVATAPGNRTGVEDEEDNNKSHQDDDAPLYTVTVHSRPDPSTSTATTLPTKESDLAQPPWIITLDNFLSAEECQALILQGQEAGYKRSRDVGDEKYDGTFDDIESEGRTSENSWCSEEVGCRSHPLVRRVLDRISNLTNVPTVNYEDFQILRYQVGQFYQVHHDYIPYQAERACGPRILTFFLYLSTVEAGGGTSFPYLHNNLTIIPQQGRALLWPSVLNSDPSEVDDRTHHEALPVFAGTKYAANAWMHLRDFETPHAKGCS